MKPVIEIVTKDAKETQKLGRLFAESLGHRLCRHALLISLEGDLGSGKTTFTQGFAEGLGIREKIQSPTFVIMKIYTLKKRKHFHNFIHCDAYRVGAKDFAALGWKEILRNPKNAILIEWGDKIKKIFKAPYWKITFLHQRGNIRTITFAYAKAN